jgi:hypothetical protein
MVPEALLSTVLVDFVGTPVDDVVVAIVHVNPERPQDSGLDDAQSWIDPNRPELSRVLLRVDGNYTSLDDLDSDEAMIVELAGHLQDYVIDQTSQPWPVFADQSGKERVLVPRLDDHGAPVWAAESLADRPIGRGLTATPSRP